MKYDEKALISAGFSRKRDYRIKKNIPNYLHWANLFAAGEFIRIELNFIVGEWKVVKIFSEGEVANKRLEDHLKSESLEDVVAFIQKFPMSTF